MAVATSAILVALMSSTLVRMVAQNRFACDSAAWRRDAEAGLAMRVMGRAEVLPGRPYPLGATWDGSGVNFAIYSEHAEKVELCIFDSRVRVSCVAWCYPNIPIRCGTGICRKLNAARSTAIAYGPYDPENGHQLQQQQAPDRPVREATVRNNQVDRCEFWLSRRLVASRPFVRSSR